MRYENLNLDGRGWKRTRVFDLPPSTSGDYWAAVTDVACPVCATGKLRWAEAGYVPGYRICDNCKRHFLAAGTLAAPNVRRVGRRKG